MCAGTAKIHGLDVVSSVDAVRGLMGVCPQFDTLWPELTCLETVLFYVRLKGVERKHELAQARESLAQVELAASASKLVKELSGGMRRRLSIAIAMVGDPKVIFVSQAASGRERGEKSCPV